MNILKILIITGWWWLLIPSARLWATETSNPNRMPPLPNPKRIVSTSLAGDEILLLLKSKEKQEVKGLEKTDSQTAWHGVLAVSSRAQFPEESNVTDIAAKIPLRFGGEPESVLAMKPDLVIASAFNRPELLTLLRRFKIPVVLLQAFDSFDDIKKNIALIGDAIAMPEDAKEMQRAFQGRLQTLLQERDKRFGTSKIPALIYASTDQVMAKETIADEVLTTAGGENLASKAGMKRWPTVNSEVLARWAPRFIIVPGDPSKRSQYLGEMRQAAGWKQMDAVRQDHLIVIPNQWMTAVSPFVLEAVERLHKELSVH